MHNAQDNSKHGSDGYNDPAHGWSDGDAASSQWHPSAQSGYDVEATPRSNHYHLGGTGSMNNPGYYDNTGQVDYSFGPVGHTPAMASPYRLNPRGDMYANTDGPWGDDPSYASTETPQEQSYYGKGKSVSYDSAPANHGADMYHDQAYTADTSSGMGSTSRTGSTSATNYSSPYSNAVFNSRGGVENEIEVDDDTAQGEYEEGDDDEEEEEDIARAINQSRHDAYYGVDHAAGSSAAAAAYAPTLDPSASLSGVMANLNLQEGGESSMGVDPSSFQVMHSSYYQPGYVFKMFWCEPRGKQKNGKSPVLPTDANLNYARNFYTGVRRFVIIATDNAHHSTCVPILTYERRACTKPGIQPGTHGIIYSHGHSPTLLQGEKDLGFPPVSCAMYPHHTLAKESRVNYSKLITIEHNVEVEFIGQITDSDFTIVQEAVDDCWGKKNRNTRNPKPKPKDTKPHKPKPPKSSRSKPESESKHKSNSSKTPTDKKHSKKTH